MKFYLYVNGDVTYSNGAGNIEKVLKQAAQKERRYMISHTDYRMLVSAAIKMQIEASKKLQFITYTFAFDPTEDQAQRIFNNHLKNLTKTFNVERYIWTKERQKNSRLHYHLLGETGYIPIKTLQNSFNNSIRNVNKLFDISFNSVRLPPRSHNNIYNSPVAIAKYIGKYISKERGKGYKRRSWAISQSLYPLKSEISQQDLMNLQKRYQSVVPKSNDENFGVILLKNFQIL